MLVGRAAPLARGRGGQEGSQQGRTGKRHRPGRGIWKAAAAREAWAAGLLLVVNQCLPLRSPAPVL